VTPSEPAGQGAGRRAAGEVRVAADDAPRVPIWEWGVRDVALVVGVGIALISLAACALRIVAEGLHVVSEWILTSAYL
jgi:hypothetical protein